MCSLDPTLRPGDAALLHDPIRPVTVVEGPFSDADRPLWFRVELSDGLVIPVGDGPFFELALTRA